MSESGPDGTSASAAAEQRWSGRLALKLAPFGQEAAQGVNVAFDLQGNPAQGQLDLSTPMGTLVAQVRWHEAVATMTTADGSETYDSLEVLTRKVLGESLPVAAMMSWLHGRPSPEPSMAAAAGGKPAKQFAQLGWDIDLRELDSGTLLARREATAAQRGVTLRVRLDR